MRRLLIPVGLLALALVAGCGGSVDGPKTVDVSGSVELDGQPIPEGDIVFRPTNGEGRSDAGRIENGKFSFKSTLGPKKVVITARRTKPGSGPAVLESGETNVTIEQYVPPKFNEQSKLEAEVTADGGNEFPFALES